MDIIITLKPYLAKLKIEQSVKPKQDKIKVPTLRALADSIEMNETHLSRIANNQVKDVRRKTFAKIIAELRRRGFDTDVSDILVFIDDE